MSRLHRLMVTGVLGGNKGIVYPSDLILYDRFTGADGTLLVAHTPDKGGPWVSARDSVDLLSNQAHFATGSVAPVAATVTVADPLNVTLSCTVKALATGGAGGYFIRFTSGLNYHYILYTQTSGIAGKIEIIRRNPLAVLATSGSIPTVTNYTYVLEVVLSGNDITATIRGHLVAGTTITANDATNASAATRGIMLDNANCRIDELQVTP